MQKSNQIRAAVEAYGGYKKLGDVLGISGEAIMGWAKSRRVPFERVATVCRKTGLRPSVANPAAFEHAKEIVQLEQDFENRNR